MARRKAVRAERRRKSEVGGESEENPLIVSCLAFVSPATQLTAQVWTSARRRAYHTAWPFVHSGYKVVQKPIMSEINPYVDYSCAITTNRKLMATVVYGMV
jgi:6-phosphofructo-2-kinase/fructose-2,6-biphosphatase 4